MNFQVYDLLHEQYHLLESDIFFILATKDLELQPFTLPVTVQQKEPSGAEKKEKKKEKKGTYFYFIFYFVLLHVYPCKYRVLKLSKG